MNAEDRLGAGSGCSGTDDGGFAGMALGANLGDERGGCRPLQMGSALGEGRLVRVGGSLDPKIWSRRRSVIGSPRGGVRAFRGRHLVVR